MNPFFSHSSSSFLFQNPIPNPSFQQLSAPLRPPPPPPVPLFPSDRIPRISPQNPNSNSYLPPPLVPPILSELTPQISSQNPISNPSLPPNPTIQEAISAVDLSLTLAQSTLQSISHFLNLPPSNPSQNDLISCLFNPNHLLPPHSLFSHFLSCTSSPSIVPVSLLDSLRYPSSLLDPPNESRFPQSDADLCLSLDEYIGFGSSSFFYKDCPGVVESSDLGSVKRTFILPAVLSFECENFCRDGGDVEIKKEVVTNVSLLPSDILAVRREVMAWKDYVSSYSYSVLQAVCCLERMRKSDILNWVIGNSPRYGIVIDVAMQDHLFVVLKLCLKAILREGLKLSDSVMRGESILGEKLQSMMFDCPSFNEVMMWLGSQLSVLYGEMDGKFFAIQMISQCLLSAGSCSMSFVLEEREKRDLNCTETSLAKHKIFVSQVAAGIAALHERSLLEARIRDLRFGRLPSKIELIDELSAMLLRAKKERSKRPDYRAIIEHDGLLWQQPHSQESVKKKTREELLAEERDYKRRRMSYRAKKVKRTAIEVLRDIIEQHMEDIKQVGGTECLVKSACEPVSDSTFERASTSDKLKGSRHHSVEKYHGHFDFHERQVDTGCSMTSNRLVDSCTVGKSGASNDLKDVHRHQTYEHRASKNPREDRNRSVSKDSHDKEYRSRSAYSYRGYSKSYERNRHQREDNIKEVESKYERNGIFSSNGSKHQDDQSFSAARDSMMGKYDRMPYRKDRRGYQMYWKHKSDSVTPGTFDDRYDPSGLDDRYDEFCRVSHDCTDTRPDELYRPADDAKKNILQKIDYSSDEHQDCHQRRP